MICTTAITLLYVDHWTRTSFQTIFWSPSLRLVSLTAALCCLLSDYGNVILTLGNAIVQQTVKIDNLRFACVHQHEDARCADTQMKLFAAFSHVKCQAD